MSKKTVILGASGKPNRYSYLAAHKLRSKDHEIVPLSIHKGNVVETEILDLNKKPEIEEVDTVTMYVNRNHQKEWEDYILSLNPKRIIFNPGAENPSLQSKAEKQGIETLKACTLVMLNTGQY